MCVCFPCPKNIIARLTVLKNTNFLNYRQVTTYHTRILFKNLSGCPCLWNYIVIIYLLIKVHSCFIIHDSCTVFEPWVEHLPPFKKSFSKKLVSQLGMCFPFICTDNIGGIRSGRTFNISCSLIFKTQNIYSCSWLLLEMIYFLWFPLYFIHTSFKIALITFCHIL